MDKQLVLNMFLTGLLFGAGPCMASCGPILIAYIAGTGKNAAKALLSYIIFSLARVSVYLLLSLAIYSIGALAVEKISGSYSWLIYKIGGSFIILTGIFVSMSRRIEYPSFLKKIGRGLLADDKKSVFILGLITGLLPCAPLLAVFSYIALAARSSLESSVYSLSFGAGTALSPLILLAMASGVVSDFAGKGKSNYRGIFNLVCGFIIISLGIALFIRR